MDEIYTIVRYFYFAWAFLLFMAMVYCGIQDILLGRKCGHVQLIPEHYLFAISSLAGCLILFSSIAEILLQDVMGGLRVFLPVLFLLPASVGTYQGSRRLSMHRTAIARGACIQGAPHEDH